MAGYPAWNQESARSIIAGLAHLEGATLPILHALQEEFGHVDAQAVPLIAEALNLSRAEIHGAISFYHDFRAAPPPQRVIKLCRAEACQALGADGLVTYVREAGLVLGETSANGAVTVEQVFCLGNCALGPSVEVNGRLYGRVGPARLGSMLNGEVSS